MTAAPARRRLLRHTAAALLAAPLAACGFKLRQPPNFSFQSLSLAMPDTALAVELRRQLQATGRTVFKAGEPGADQADITLRSSGEVRDRTPLSYTSSGEVRELQLRIVFSFSLHAPDGRELLPASEITRQIDQSYSESAALSKEQEAQMLFQSLQSDVVQQVMRRLATIKP